MTDMKKIVIAGAGAYHFAPAIFEDLFIRYRVSAELWMVDSDLDMAELSDLMAELGCAAAFNLDGGQSSQMTFRHEVVNTPVNGGRYVNDIVMIRDVFAREVEE